MGLDVFTGKKHEEILREDAQLVTNSKQDYLLTKIEGPRAVLSTMAGDTTDGGWTLPSGELGEEIREKFEEGYCPMKVTVLRALGKAQIVSWARVKSQ